MWRKSALFICVGALAQLAWAEVKEVAAGKGGTLPANPYRVDNEVMAARITDGDSRSVFTGSGATCALVSRMKKPFITIDLGKTYYIASVELWLRGLTSVAARDSNIEVRVGMSQDYRDNAVCGFKAGYFGTTDTLTCSEPLKGQYITVYRNDDVSDYLQVCEMKAFADAGFISSCVCWGDPHCQSFDRAAWLHFQGSCSYTMVQDNCEGGLPNGPPRVQVIADNKKDHPAHGVSLVREMMMIIAEYDMTIEIRQGRVTLVNGEVVQGTPYHPNDAVSITTSGTYVHVTVENSVRIRYDGIYNAYVDIPRHLAGKVCGLCGDADGNAGNDWMVGPSEECMDKFGGAVRKGQISGDLNVVGTSWMAFADEDDTCKTECPEPPVVDGCTRVSQTLAEEHCDKLRNSQGPFGECLGRMSADRAKSFFDNCVFDSCSLEIYDEIACTFGRALAEECFKEHELTISWRTDDYCPMTCPAGMVYSVCGNPCMPTCTDLKGETCGIPAGECEEGCFCKAGMVFDGKKCISKSTCGCLYEKQGVTIAVGEKFFAEDCSEKCECKEAGGDLQCTDTTCKGLEVCGEVDGKPACVCDDPNFVNDGKCRPPSFLCSLPKDIGTGSQSQNRFFFNKEKCKCIKFTYKGSGGNANNFASSDECLASCTGFEPPAQCLMGPDGGDCDGSKTMFYYNEDLNACKKLSYSGCGGNDNRFDTKLECRDLCKRC